ncbi:hypothetical protein J2W28_005692 [Variovorax boronicumulans]|nr:hypothetical protein [Variovorax boronicumulans]MDQ0006521.1 hypothetical protein [Variovorax boronicumulans]
MPLVAHIIGHARTGRFSEAQLCERMTTTHWMIVNPGFNNLALREMARRVCLTYTSQIV